jgi:hypothetical protein
MVDASFDFPALLPLRILEGRFTVYLISFI